MGCGLSLPRREKLICESPDYLFFKDNGGHAAALKCCARLYAEACISLRGELALPFDAFAVAFGLTWDRYVEAACGLFDTDISGDISFAEASYELLFPLVCLTPLRSSSTASPSLR
jgi:hypothetical protein